MLRHLALFVALDNKVQLSLEVGRRGGSVRPDDGLLIFAYKWCGRVASGLDDNAGCDGEERSLAFGQLEDVAESTNEYTSVS